jgi:transcriptional regulator with XRE-family HTH domain
MDIDHFLAQRVRALRKQHGLSLAQLAERSGVSRSMISLIEREETSPTAVVLNKLAGALNVSLAALFADDDAKAGQAPLARFAAQQLWTDPESGYMRRHLSPGSDVSPLELAEVTFPAGKTVTFENALRNVDAHQQVWMLAGEMKVTVDETVWHLFPGDCLAMALGRRIVFHNPTAAAARYLVALATHPAGSRRI